MTTMISIGGEAHNVSGLQIPENREFRSAWQLEGDVIEVDVEKAKPIAISKIDEAHADILKKMTGGVSIEERDTWQPKAIAAQAIIDGVADDGQIEMITVEAQMADETTEALANSIIAKANKYKQMIGLASGHRRATAKVITAATTIGEIETILSEAKIKSDEQIASLG